MNATGGMLRNYAPVIFCFWRNHGAHWVCLEMARMDQFFLVEMIAIPWFIVPIFGLIEENLQRFDKEHRGEENEYIND